MKKILVTTTSSIEGQSIQRYFDPISANIVIGSNVFSDIAAVWKDFFGGNVGTYERKLEKIYEDVIAKLKKKAKALSANAIIGLKIDIDEVSGGGKQMFMITAVATPVKFVILDEEGRNNDLNVSGNLVETKVKAHKLLNANLSPDRLSDEHIEFITESRFSEFIPLMLAVLKYYLSEDGMIVVGAEVAEKKRAAVIEYFGTVDAEKLIEQLYNEFSAADNIGYFRELMKVIAAYDLLDYQKAGNLIKSGKLLAAKFGLWTLALPQKSYSMRDIEAIEALLPVIRSAFQPVSQVMSKKKLLGGSEEVWTCICSMVNGASTTYCSKCSSDIYGFAKGEKTPDGVISLLENRATVIRSLLQAKEEFVS